MKFNLGCGTQKKAGYVNVDRSEAVKPDVLADITVLPWKWAKTNSAERIEMDNLAEHIEPYLWIRVVRECHRVLKPDGVLWLKVPELRPGNEMAAFSDPTHVNFFTIQTSDYYYYKHPRWQAFGRAYGIPPFERIENRRHSVFLLISLRKRKDGC
ncbi:hypothetical protein ES703_40356 [subsurface metagenome]